MHKPSHCGYTGNKAHHIIPSRHNRLHIQIAREERDDTVRNRLAHLDEDTAEIPYYRWIVSDFEPGTDGDLITASCDDLEESRISN